jgi:hypothetical protein
VLKVAFVRRRGQRDRVYATRSDGSSTAWDFPSYGDGLPHDLCHLVVEDALRLDDGFWGLIDKGADVRLVRNESTLVRNGMPLAEWPDVDLSGLMYAEAAVAELAGPIQSGDDQMLDATEFASSEDVVALRKRLRDLRTTWSELPDGKALHLFFGGPGVI